MINNHLMYSVAPIALMFSTVANAAPLGENADITMAAPDPAEARAEAPAKKAPAEEAFTTGVAKGRDRLNSATSTSAIKASEIEKLSARSLGEVLRSIPGVRVEYAGGEGNASYSIRGLPLAASGSKFLQFQEDGLPVLEFGDIQQLSTDMFMRVDLNTGAVEAIRGGSASTFASNSPGGVINFLSKTGDVEGGAVQTTLGLNYGEHRIDADYGHKISDTLRFHVGGFWRQGEGPRNVGFDAYRGGQIKFNITKTFGNGYVRVYGKYLDDHTPTYQPMPVLVSGTDANPVFTNIANFNIKTDSLLSPNNSNIITLDANNRIKRDDVRDGQHAIVKSLGFETQLDFGDWTVSEKFRFAAISGANLRHNPFSVAPAATLALSTGGAGARLSYATGPLAGQAITSPTTLNGNGLLSSTVVNDYTVDSLDNVTNDLRVSRVWKLGKGDLTTTAGFYKSAQDIKVAWSFLQVLSDVVGDGNSALVNVTTAAGVANTQDGYISFGFGGGGFQRYFNVNYAVNAPYGSVNYQIGKLAIGGSVRYDIGAVNGTVFGSNLGGGRVGVAPIDLNGDGRISVPEARTGVLPLGNPGKVDYNYRYLSYSTGINFRIAEPLAVFGRYSRGGRAAADRLLFTAAISPVTGLPLDPSSEYDIVKQSEIGLKFRQSGATLNITGFSAQTTEQNTQVGSGPPENIVRGYSAKGVEVEAGIRRGIFGLTAGGTYTSAKITSDKTRADLIGKVPRHQSSFIFQATPQIDTKYVTVGTTLIGTTSSFAQDTNLLTLPGYTLVNAFLQVRPINRIQVMFNVNNLFDTLAFAETTQATIPASGIVQGRAYSGRTVSATMRYAF